MLTLPHHVELLSDGWIAEAERCLMREMALRKALLDGATFSLSIRLSDAPPHLKWDGGTRAVSLRHDGERLSIAHAHDPHADMVIEGDYQAALCAAQFVGVLVPGGLEELLREVRHIFGNDGLRVRGTAQHEQLRTVLGLAHDHMARRTVENPDIAHRARRLGLVQRIHEMHEQGYTVVERAISPGLADATRSAIERAVLPGQGVSMNWMLYRAREIERVTLNPLAMTLIDASLGRGAQLASMAAIIRGPGPGFIDAHTDYVNIPEPFPEYALSGVSVWAFEDWTAASGPTWIVPGSHRMRRAPRKDDDLSGGIPMEMPKGSVVFFTQAVWHWQGHRTEPGQRVTLHPHFNREFMRSVEPKRPDVQLLQRNPPRLGELLGEDDWFDKMTPDGRDHLRLAHMQALHAFTRQKMRELVNPAA